MTSACLWPHSKQQQSLLKREQCEVAESRQTGKGGFNIYLFNSLYFYWRTRDIVILIQNTRARTLTPKCYLATQHHDAVRCRIDVVKEHRFGVFCGRWVRLGNLLKITETASRDQSGVPDGLARMYCKHNAFANLRKYICYGKCTTRGSLLKAVPSVTLTCSGGCKHFVNKTMN